MRIKQRRLPGLDDVFELEDGFLSQPDAGAMRPALIPGRRREDGERVLVKYWNKTGSPLDSDLRQLWHREMRHAERIRVRPAADEVLVPVLAAEEARDAFYIVMPGEWSPLSMG